MKQPWKLWERNYTALLAIRALFYHKLFVTIVMYIMWSENLNVFIHEINYSLIYLFEQILNFNLKKNDYFKIMSLKRKLNSIKKWY